MGSELIPLVLYGVQEAIKYAPELANELRTLFNKGDPTPQDWLDIRAKYLSKSYKAYVPDTGLSDDETK